VSLETSGGIAEHRAPAHADNTSAFTRRYRATRLVHLEATDNILAAVAREKQLKRWPRRRKAHLIEKQNPAWRDLASDW
jgi:putative endonuclease